MTNYTPTKRSKVKQANLYTHNELPTLTEESVEEKLAREDALLSSYTDQSPPPKKRKPHIDTDVDITSPTKVPTRNPFCLTKNNTDDSTSRRSLTKTLSPVKKPISIVEKRKLAPLVISRFFSKPETKIAKPIDDIDNSSQKEIQEKFLHVQSLYNDSVYEALSLYCDVPDHKDGKSDANQNECKTSSEDKTIEIIEVASDSEDQKPAATKTLDKFINPKNVRNLKNVRHFYNFVCFLCM